MEIKKLKPRTKSNVTHIVFSALLTLFVSSILFSVSSQEPLLVIRNQGVSFEEVVKGLSDELSEDFSINELVLAKDAAVDQIQEKIKLTKPKVVVLMDNKSIALFKQYQSNQKEESALIPSVSLMAVLVDDAIKGLKNASGISYEIPIVTSAVNLRGLLNTPLNKIGVIHRKFLTNFLQKNEAYCKREKIDVVPYLIPDDKAKIKPNLKKAIKKIVKTDKVDALWLPNDNIMLHPSIIKEVWLPLIKKYRVPVVVGVEVLVNPKFDFGTFAVLPDHVSLGIQAAEIIFDIMDNDWIVDMTDVEPPVSIYKIINLPQVEKHFKIDKEKLQTIDKVAQ